MAIGGSEFDPSGAERIPTGIDCAFQAGVPSAYFSRQLWADIDSQQRLVVWFLALDGPSTALRFRLNVRAWAD